jgi:hypothetical protein
VVKNDSHSSGVSWGAVIAGSFVASALSPAVLALGPGIGFDGKLPAAIQMENRIYLRRGWRSSKNGMKVVLGIGNKETKHA